MRRVVVTGLGLVTPLAANVPLSWQRLLNAQSGAATVQRFDASALNARVVCEVKYGDGTDGTFCPEHSVDVKELRRNDRFIIFGMAAAAEAVADSGWQPTTDEQRYRTGVLIGSGIGGVGTIEETALVLNEKGPRRVGPFFIPSALINLVSGQVSIKYGFAGPNHAVVTACATGTHAIGDAGRLIALGDADVMLAGGCESAITPLGLAGFAACKALSTSFNDTPEQASRPFDRDRDGFVMGEGAGVVVLEEYEHAKARGAKIYAELRGYGMSGDAHHITSPAPDGNGAYRAMSAALQRAQLNPHDITYINAHGTSTPVGDDIELRTVERLFAGHSGLIMSSTKSAVGHLLGGAGAVEAVFSVLALRDSVVPPTLNLHNALPSTINLVPHTAQQHKLTNILSNSFGFGGTNASLVFSAV